MPPQQQPKSLLLEVVDWMIAPLAVFWPVAIAASYILGLSIAEGPFDRSLVERVREVAAELQHRPSAAGPARFEALERIADAADGAYVQVAADDGRWLAGDPDLPIPHADQCPRNEVRLRDLAVEDAELRVACERVKTSTGAIEMVQVGERTDARREHARHVAHMVMTVVVVLVPMTLALTAAALLRGLGPLRRLRASIEARGPTDLSPLPMQDVPEEVAPLVATINLQLERVRASLEGQRRFVADAAHQLRTPLAGLKTIAQASGNTRIAEGADHLARLASQLLALARADEAAPVASRSLDLGAILRLACHDVFDAASARGVRLALEVPESGVFVAGEAELLHALFLNLVDNAVRYTPPGGEVVVRASAAPSPVVEVEDTGPGVPVEERALVFDRFYRSPGTQQPGSGLGLSIVKSIAQRHGASVTLASGAQGRGALFRVAFPAP